MPTEQKIGQVEQTTNYDQFVIMHNNRDTYTAHIEQLKVAFQEHGNLTIVQPIIVNEKMEIIDGQNRFFAAQDLSEPIFYLMREGLTIADARQMNILQRQWSTDDFAKSYAVSGDKNYQQYVALKEEFNVNHSIMLAAIYGDSKGSFAKFRKGELIIDPDDLERIRTTLDQVTQIREAAEIYDLPFANAAVKVVQVHGFTLSRMLNKIKLHGPAVIRRYSAVSDNLRMLEDVYNYGNSEANRLRLY